MRNLWLFFQNEEADLNLDECGIQTYSPSEAYDYNVYQTFVIHYVDAGYGYLEVEGKKYRLGPGDGYVIKASQHVKYYPDTREPWVTYWVGISGRQLDTYIKGTQLHKTSFITFLEDGYAQLLIKEICHTSLELKNSLPTPFWYKSKLYLLMDAIQKELTHRLAKTTHTSEDLSKIAYQYINNNYMKPITIDGIASFLGISRSYFYKIFKNRYKVSPNQYLLDRRLTIAASLLLSTNHTISEVAEKVGFTDPLYFSKRFSNYYAISPRSFRKQSNYDSYKESWEKFQ